MEESKVLYRVMKSKTKLDLVGSYSQGIVEGNKLINAILAGGQGLRLWPESTIENPKQICDFFGKGSLLAMTLQRLQPLGSLLVIAGEQQRDLIKAELDTWKADLLTEPLSRNTAPAVGLVLTSEEYPDDEVIGFFPADHYIQDDLKFRLVLMKAEEIAQKGYLVTVGIVPTYPETGYGYIERDKELESGSGTYLVQAFHEKPDMSTAMEYVQSETFYWNAGIYLATARTWRKLLQQYVPNLYEYVVLGKESYLANYYTFPNISIDYAIAEKCHQMAVVEGDFGWSDVGNWDSLATLLHQDRDGNAMSGTAIAIDCIGCLGRGKEKKLVLFGLKDTVVVETDDTILVCPRSRSQDIKTLLNRLNHESQ